MLGSFGFTAMSPLSDMPTVCQSLVCIAPLSEWLRTAMPELSCCVPYTSYGN